MSLNTDVQTLMEMGFSEVRAQRALAKTNYKGVQLAMDWLFAHEDDPDIDEPFEAPKGHTLSEVSNKNEQDVEMGNSAGGGGEPCQDEQPAEPQVAKSLKCDECGKLLKGEMEVQAHAARTQHSSFSESTEEIKPLTEAEKKEQLAKLQERIKKNRIEREEREKKEQLEREKARRTSGKEIVNIKQKVEENEIKKLAEQRRKEKLDDALARKKVKEQIERDRLERQSAAKKTKEDVPVPAAPAAAAAVPVEKKSYTDCQLQIRLPNGDVLNSKFSAKETLAAVRLYIELNRTVDFGPFNLRQNFPPKVYLPEDYEKPLDALGLVPRANLLAVKK